LTRTWPGQPVCCFIKHTNACGAAADPNPLEAYRRAYLGDPNAAMGGILAVNSPVTVDLAAAVMETYQRWGKPLKEAGAPYAPGGFFVEVWLAPSFDDDAVRIIRGEHEASPTLPNPPRKDWGKRVRLLAVGDMSVPPDPSEMDFKRIAGGMLMQTRDLVGLNEEQWKVVAQRQPTETEMNDLRLAWLVCKHTKSNAISICRDGMLIGNGAGQMSRVMSCRIATWLAKENGHAEALKGAAAATDGFFPFRDGPEILMEAGVTAIIQPGGGKREQDVIEACNQRGVAMIFTGTRHFKH
jgi:phosphoribosylaminoimidazolecarboxamide formyltransferase/IMP cyclohydrolase